VDSTNCFELSEPKDIVTDNWKELKIK
jgi:hypothetical protein